MDPEYVYPELEYPDLGRTGFLDGLLFDVTILPAYAFPLAWASFAASFVSLESFLWRFLGRPWVEGLLFFHFEYPREILRDFVRNLCWRVMVVRCSLLLLRYSRSSLESSCKVLEWCLFLE